MRNHTRKRPLVPYPLVQSEGCSSSKGCLTSKSTGRSYPGALDFDCFKNCLADAPRTSTLLVRCDALRFRSS